MKSNKIEHLTNWGLTRRIFQKNTLLLTSILVFGGCSIHLIRKSYYTNDQTINRYIQDIEEGMNIKVKNDACSSLRSLNDKRTVDFFITALKEIPEIRPCATIALGNLGDTRAIEPLKSQIYITNSIGQTILDRLTLESLGKLGNEETLEFLVLVNKGYNPTEKVEQKSKKVLEEVIQSLRQRLGH